MKGKITERGWLMIERPGLKGAAMQEQNCPRQQGTAGCGDWCPFFSEPGPGFSVGDKSASIEICEGRILRFEEFTDERRK
jgi:hypothetical protein